MTPSLDIPRTRTRPKPVLTSVERADIRALHARAAKLRALGLHREAERTLARANDVRWRRGAAA